MSDLFVKHDALQVVCHANGWKIAKATRNGRVRWFATSAGQCSPEQQSLLYALQWAKRNHATPGEN